MHPRNCHLNGYDFVQLASAYPPLEAFMAPNPVGKLTIDFAQPKAVKALNAALLVHHYGVKHWDIPDGYLCPAVPGRADYVHFIADLLAADNAGVIPTGKSVKGLDIGTGANLIYPIVATRTYHWQMVGSDIHVPSFKNATLIAQSNAHLKNHISVRRQASPKQIFSGIIQPQEMFAFTMCNPPFHDSPTAALSGSVKKNKNLARHQHKRRGKESTANNPQSLNFGGQHNELWCEGGEWMFVKQMLNESVKFANQVGWFTSLISKKQHVDSLVKHAESLHVQDCRVVEMTQGAKVSRFIAWRF